MPVICSVAHGGFELYNGPGYGRVITYGRGEPGAEIARYTVTRFPAVIEEPEDVGNDKKIIHKRDGFVEAKRLAAPYLDRGVFAPDGDEPTEAEIKAAEDRYHASLRTAIEEGMKQWEKRHLPQDVDQMAKTGAYVFRLNVPWGVPAASAITIECEGCGERISPKLAFHAACGSIFDEERAISLGYVPAIEAKAARLRLAALQNAPAQPAGKQANR